MEKGQEVNESDDREGCCSRDKTGWICFGDIENGDGKNCQSYEIMFRATSSFGFVA
jgi:hypothetical protein